MRPPAPPDRDVEPAQQMAIDAQHGVERDHDREIEPIRRPGAGQRSGRADTGVEVGDVGLEGPERLAHRGARPGRVREARSGEDRDVNTMDGDTRRHCGRSGLKPTLGDRIRRGRGDHVHLVAGGGELASQIAQLELDPPPAGGETNRRRGRSSEDHPLA